MRQYSLIDNILIQFDRACAAFFSTTEKTENPRAYPAEHEPAHHLSAAERKHSAALMRVNYAGEVCAQALYQGQSLCERDENIKELLQHAAIEEADHLRWCQQRINELNDRTSWLNPVWHAGALLIGIAISLTGKNISMSFLAETEKQVYEHLAKHLQLLPKNDMKSRAILRQMQIDEQQHQITAEQHGASELPEWFKTWMRYTAKIMTKVAYFV